MSDGEGGREPLIRLSGVSKVYPHRAGDVIALDRVSLEIWRGDFIAVMGPSGSGKSTLLNLIGCLDLPTSGDLLIHGKNVNQLSDDQLTELRRCHIGFVFQIFNLIPLLNVVENVELPCILKEGRKGCREKYRELLLTMDIEPEFFQHRPPELSGGQQQRVAIARALVNDPEIILCDEPTGNLDTRTGLGIMEILRGLNERGRTVIVVTHDPKVASFAKRRLEMMDGRFV